MKKAIAIGILAFSALGHITVAGSNACKLCNQVIHPEPPQHSGAVCKEGGLKPEEKKERHGKSVERQEKEKSFPKGL